MKILSLAAGILGVVGVCAYRRHLQRSDFQKQVVLITGGSRGLGLAMAREFGRRGARLALLARDSEELDRAARDLQKRGITVSTHVCNLPDENAIRETISAIVAETGRLDVLVNNAGVMLVAPLELMDPADFASAMDIHFWGPYRMTREVLPYLRAFANGRIVNIASIGGRLAVPHMAPYAASKFALVGYSDAIRAELAKDGVRVTTVSPGLMRTGSHVNASFKGKVENEFAWFATGAATPLVSLSAERAARKIVSAASSGRPELTLGWTARVATIIQALLPNTTARLVQVIGKLLPRPANLKDRESHPGWESRSEELPAALTYMADRAIPTHNEGYG